MSDDLFSAPDGQSVQDTVRPRGNPLGFSLEFREGIALVTLRDRKLAQNLLIENLALEVPEVKFPFDVAGGAEQFRHHRCRLRTMVFSIGQSDLRGLLASLLDPARYGLTDVDVMLEQGHGLLRGRWQVGKESTPFTARFVAESGGELSVRLGMMDVRIFGPMSLPASALVAQLGRALKPLRVSLSDSAYLTFHPVRDLIRWLLPVHGWKIPDLDGLRVDRVEMENGRIRLVTVRYPDELPPATSPDKPSYKSRSIVEREYLIFKEGTKAYHNAELALHEGRLEEARKLYLGKGGVEPTHPHAARRMLEMGVVRPERFDQVEDLVRDLLEKDADFLPALIARAVQDERNKQAAAGRTFEQIGRLVSDRGERHDAIIAHLKAGALLREAEPQKAIGNYERVLELDPDHILAMRTLTAMYQQENQWYRALRMNLRLAHHVEDPEEIAACHVRMGNIFLERFDDLDRARKHLDAALTHDASNLLALSAQAAVRQRLGQPTRAVKLLLKLIELADLEQDQQLIFDTRMRLAKLWEDDLQDPASALLHYERILADNPEHLHALYKVGSIASEQERWDQASAAFSRLLEMESAGHPLPQEVVKSTCLALGRIYMSRPEGQKEARAMLHRAASLEEDDLTVWLELEKLDREAGAWTELLEVLERKIQLLKDPEEIQAAVLEAARISDRQLGDRARAESLYQKALEMQPTSLEAVEGLTVLLHSQGRWTDLTQILMTAASQETDTRVAAEYWSRVGEIKVEKLEDLQGGIESLKKAIDLDPSGRVNAKRLLGLFREHERFGELVDLIGRLSADTWEPGELVDIWLERARLLDDKLERREEAIESYLYALKIEPDLLQAHRALADLYFEKKQWPEARESVSKVLDHAGEGGLSGPGRTELHRRLAVIELAIGNREAAIEQYRIVLSRFEDDEETASILGQLLRDDERWEELAAFYAQRAERAESENAAALHTAAAAIWWQKLKMPEPAASQYQRAVQAAPRSDAAAARLASLQRVYASLGRWAEVVEVIEERINFAQPSEKAPMYMALAAIYSSRLEDVDSAAECWEHALQLDPNHRPSLLMLARRRFEQARYEEALSLGERALASDPEGAALPVERRASVALDAARAAWALELYENAARMYLEHMEAFANRKYSGVEPEALERLEYVLRRQEKYEDLALLYRRWLVSGAMPDRRASLRRALALLLFEHLDQPDEAIEVLGEQVLEFSDDQQSVTDLMNMLRDSARWEQLAQLLQEQWDRAPLQEDRIRRLEELAEINQLRLHQPEEAIEHWKKLSELGHEVAAEKLTGIYHQEGMHNRLAELLRYRAESARDFSEAKEYYRDLGRLARDELEDHELALEAFQQAYELEPSPKNRNTLLNLLRDMSDPDRLEEFLSRCAEDEEDPGVKKNLLLEHAELCLGKLDRRPEAIISLREAISLEVDESTVHRTQSLYEEEQDWEGVADMQEILVDLAEDDSAAARRIHRLGHIFLDHLQAPERAAAAFERAAELDAGWLQPLTDLIAILESQQNWQRVLKLKLRIARAVSEPVEQSSQLQAAARLAFEKLEDVSRGIELLEQAADHAADPVPVLVELSDRCEEAERYSQAADALERIVVEGREISEATETPAALFKRLANLRMLAGEEEFAIAAYEQTLRLEPSDEASAEQLESVYREHGRFQDLAMMLEELAGRKKGAESADCWVKASQNWLESGDDRVAEMALKKALAAHPAHEIATSGLARLLLKREAWKELLRFLQGLSEAMLGSQGVSSAAVVCFDKISANPEDPEQELAVCRMMLRVDPEHLQAMRRLAQLLQESGEAEEAESALRQLDARADLLEVDQRYELDFALANIDFSRGRIEEAEQRMKRCKEARPEDPAPRDFLHKLYTGGQRFSDQVALLLDEAEQAWNEEERFERLTKAAGLMESELGDPQSAAVIYERMVEDDPKRLEDWRKLADLQRLLDKPEKQRLALMRVAELTLGEESAAALRKATRLAHDVLKDGQAARQGWNALLEVAPQDTEALDRLLALDRQDESHAELDEHLQLRISVCEDPALKADLLRERADLLLARLERPADAIGVLEELEQLRPSDSDVLIQLAELYEQKQSWPELARILTIQVKQAGSERDRALLLSELAEVRRLRLDDREGAIEAYRKAASLDPEDLEPLQRLRDIAADSQDDDLLAEVLEVLATRTADEQEELELRRSVGLLRWSGKQKDDARRAFQRALAIDSDDGVSRRFLAEILFSQDPSSAVAHIRWLLEHSDLLTPPEMLKCKRWLVEALSDADPAERIEALKQLLEADPKDLPAAQQLAGLYKETRNHRALADLLGQIGEMDIAKAGADLWIERGDILLRDGDVSEASRAFARALALEGEHRYEVGLRLAKIQLQDLKDESAAARTLETVLEVRPEDTTALKQLSDLYWSMGSWEQAATTTQKLMDRTDEEHLPGLLLRLGDIQLRLDKSAEARVVFEKAIELDPAYRVAYQRLEEIHKQSKDDGQLARFYLAWAASPAAGAKRVSLYSSGARHLERSGDVPGSIQAYKESLKLDPSNPEVCESLAPLLSREERWEELLEVLKQRTDLAEEPERKIALAFEMGELCKEHLEDLDQASIHFAFCLEVDPQYAPALEELAEILYARQEWERTAELYDRLEERGLSSRWFVIAFRRGEIAEAQSNLEQAAAHYQRSIELNPTFIPSRQNLIRVLIQSARFEEVVDAIQSLLALMPEEGFEELVLELWRQLGRAQRKLLRFDDAAESFSEVYKRNPQDLEAVRMLKNLAINRQHWEEAATFSRRELEISPDAPGVMEQWVALGDIFAGQLHRPEEAVTAYREAISLDPMELGPKLKLWAILKSSSDWAAVQELGEAMLATPHDAEVAADIHRTLGQAYLKSGNPESALSHYERLLASQSVDLDLLDQVANLAHSQERWTLYTSLRGQSLEARLQAGLDPEEILASYLALANVYQEHLGDVAKAAACIRRALELHPRDPELMRRLGNLYASDWETYQEAIEVFRELAGMDPTDPELYRYLARLEAARGDKDRTAGYYGGLRFLMPMDEEARRYLNYVGTVGIPQRAMERSEWDEVMLHPGADCLLQRMVSMLAPYLEQLFPADLSRFGVGGDQMIGQQNYPDVMEAAESSRRLVSGRPFSLFVVPNNNAYTAWLESGGTPAILISSAVLERSTKSELNFFIAREVVKVAMGFVLPQKLSRSDLLQLLALLCKLARPEDPPPVALPATAPQYLAAISRVTPPNVMEMVAPLIRRYALEPRAHDIDRWFAGVQRTADRIGLLAAGDLNTAMSVLTRVSEVSGGRDLAFIPDRGGLLSRDPNMLALFRFAFSEPFLNMRKEFGGQQSEPTPPVQE